MSLIAAIDWRTLLKKSPKNIIQSLSRAFHLSTFAADELWKGFILAESIMQPLPLILRLTVAQKTDTVITANCEQVLFVVSLLFELRKCPIMFTRDLRKKY